ncbi:hypothetical protein KHQ81_00175 [Mycoplasmatota bacterium]|nr:hypothetical protein KHQ81_00175 [Mycoplasmatota bacterium]
MYVRVYDLKNNRYYKSIVYGIVDGYIKQFIVLNPFLNAFELVDYIDKRNKECNTFINMINPDKSEWVSLKNAYLLKYKKYCKEKNVKFSLEAFNGYEDIYNNFEFMEKLIRDKLVPVENLNVELRNLDDENEWHYIRTQDDANEFLKLFANFHDSTLESLNYTEDNNTRKLNVIFNNTCWYGIVELCFEGLIAMNLRPAGDNCFRYLYSGCLIVKDECVFWADEYLEDEDLNYEYNFIKAFNVKWKDIEGTKQ